MREFWGIFRSQVFHSPPNQGWAIPGFGQQYYTQYYTGQKYAKLYNTLYQYYTKSNQLILSVKQQHTVIF